MIMAERLELPRPLQLLRMAGWNLAEAFGLPIIGYVVGTSFWGRSAGLWAMLAAIWIAAAIRKLVTGSVPALVWISAVVLTVQTVVAIATGNLFIFLVHFPIANLGLAILFALTARGRSPLAGRLATEVVGLPRLPARQPELHRFFQDATWLWAGIFLLLGGILGALLVTVPISTYVLFWAVTTIALLAAGAAASVVWFRAVLRRIGVRLCFASAATVGSTWQPGPGNGQPGPGNSGQPGLGNGQPGPGNGDRRRIFPIRPLRHRPRS